jgi:hypothetical protein
MPRLPWRLSLACTLSYHEAVLHLLQVLGVTAHSSVLGLQSFDTDVAGTSTAYLDRDYFLRTVGAGLEVEVLGADNIDDRLGVRTSLQARA